MPSLALGWSGVPFAAYTPVAKTWALKASSKNSCEVNSRPLAASASVRILKWMWTARPWYQPG